MTDEATADVSDAPLLTATGISKSFPGVRALSDVSLKLYPGEVLSLVGENGAGKSTLMKILSGVQAQDAGDICLDGHVCRFDHVREAMDRGIVLIHQELNLADNLSVGANIFLGREPLRLGLIDDRRIRQESRDVLARVGLDVDPETRVSDLTIGQQQLVEIAKALSMKARVLIMDEPTSSLSSRESERLFEVIRELRAAGVSVIYISHRLKEVQDLSDRVTVLRDGENAGDLQRDELNHQNLVRLMVGRDIGHVFSRTPHEPGEMILDVQSLKTTMWPAHSVSFQLRRGEIVGMAGLVGAGRTEVLRALFGIDPIVSGTVELCGRRLDLSMPSEAIHYGMALVPEDRKSEGLVLEMSVRENVGLAGLHRNRLGGLFLNSRVEQQQTTEMIERLGIRTAGDWQAAGTLSGGNQQKVVLGKWLALSPQLLLLDEPTRGIDIGAKDEIYRLVDGLAAEGMSVLFVSSEMEEILGMSDRVLVMHEGRLTGSLTREEMTEESIMELATGGREGNEANAVAASAGGGV